MRMIAHVSPCRMMAVLAIAFPAYASDASDAPAACSGSCTAEFRGTSTLHDFAGTVSATAVSAHRVSAPSSGAESWIIDAEFRVKDLTTHHEKRDKNMYAMFDQPHHPLIKGRLEGIPASASALPPTNTTLSISILDVPRQVPATITHWREQDGTREFDVDFTLKLQENGLTPPSVLGMIRVGNEVKVHSHVILTPSPASSVSGAADPRASRDKG